MKKLLVFFMVLFGISLGAMAVPKEYKSGDFVCAVVDREMDKSEKGKVYLNLEGQNAKIQLYFDIGGNKNEDLKKSIGLHDGCDAVYDEIYKQISGLSGDVQELVFIGSADGLGEKTGFDNDDLARRRVNYAADKLGKVFSWKKFITSDADAKVYSPTVENQEYRTVHVYVIWRQAQCPEKFVGNLGNYKKELTAAIASGKYSGDKDKLQNALDGVKKAETICSSGKTLVASQVEELLDVYGLLIIAGDVVASVNVLNTNVGINVSYYESSIESQYSKLISLLNKAGLSVWRNEEGKFNTARLISDSVAGVVLGTVGGIVTSKLVKKNQLKKGFEDLSCAIGGQTVAGYGDDFTVGLR